VPIAKFNGYRANCEGMPQGRSWPALFETGHTDFSASALSMTVIVPLLLDQTNRAMSPSIESAERIIASVSRRSRLLSVGQDGSAVSMVVKAIILATSASLASSRT
jgi:hypothetical protein